MIVKHITQLIRISRPRFWMYLTGPFLIGYISSVPTLSISQSLTFYLGFFYFLLPANLFIYGVNDLSDADTDRFNPKKGRQEIKLRQSHHTLLFLGLSVSFILTMLYLFTLTSQISQFFTVLTIVLGALYSIPPVRFKARPFIDSLSNIFYIFPAIVAYSEYTPDWPPLLVLLAGWCWTSAMHLYSAIPDIIPDTKAGLTTTATFLGEQKSLIMCFMLWMIFAIILLFFTSNIIAVLGFIYPLCIVYSLFNRSKIEEIYWYFPWINTVLGGVTFFSILWSRL